MLLVAQNNFYEIGYAADKNRLYFRIYGYWKSPEVVPNYLADWEKALQLAKPSFTLLADFRNMVTHPVKVKELHEQVANMFVQFGMSYLAEVSPLDKIAVLQTSSVINETKLESGKAKHSHVRVDNILLGEDILDKLS